MRFFNRCRILTNILIAICVLLGIVICLNLNFIQESAAFSSVLCMLLLLLVVVIALKCIIKDAQEDLDAVMNYLKPLNHTQDKSQMKEP